MKMHSLKAKERLAGALLIASMVTGVFSVAPAVDSLEYLTEATQHFHQTIWGAIFQFLMALCYLGFAALVYPTLNKLGSSISLAFLSFRITAAILVILGTVVLLSILTLSEVYSKNLTQEVMYFEVIGSILKTGRDYINHVFMILALCSSNIMMFWLFLKSNVLPRWLSLWGISGSLLAAGASVLVLFQLTDVISTEYIALNVPIALLDLTFAIWLITKGFSKSTNTQNQSTLLSY